MAKELYLYSGIYSFVAESLMSQIEENATEEITLRVNTPGGSVMAGWGIAAKIKEHGNVNIKVDGSAMSMGADLLLYAKSVTALDISSIMIHRADMYTETEEDKAFLAKVNKDLKAQFTAKINSDKLKELKGVTIDELFNSEKRIDLHLTAKEAKAIGLVDKIVKLTPKEAEAFNERLFNIAAEHPQVVPQPKNKIMTIESLKAENPALYNEIFALGVSSEKDRVEAAMVFIEVDPAGVKAAIESGKPLSQKQMADFAMKSFSKESLAKLEDGNTPPVETKEVTAKTEEQKTAEAAKDALYKELGLTK